MERKKKALFALGAIIVIAILVTCISKFGTKEEDTKKLDTGTVTEVTDNTNQSANDENETKKEENKEVQEEEEQKDNRPESLDAVKMLHANEDHTYITSEDFYNHMDKIVGYNFLTTATIDELTDKEVSLKLKDGKPSVVFNTAEDYTKLLRSGKEVAAIGTLYEYNKVDGKKIATAWVSFIASGNDVEEYKGKTTDPNFIDLFK